MHLINQVHLARKVNQCIPESKVCDAHKDCTNGEDEPASCGECCLDALGVGLFR